MVQRGRGRGERRKRKKKLKLSLEINRMHVLQAFAPPCVLGLHINSMPPQPAEHLEMERGQPIVWSILRLPSCQMVDFTPRIDPCVTGKPTECYTNLQPVVNIFTKLFQASWYKHSSLLLISQLIWTLRLVDFLRAWIGWLLWGCWPHIVDSLGKALYERPSNECRDFVIKHFQKKIPVSHLGHLSAGSQKSESHTHSWTSDKC